MTEPPAPSRLAIIGAGELGRQLAHHARACGFTVVGFFDDSIATGARPGADAVLGRIDRVQPLFNEGVFDCLVMGIGYKHFGQREALFNQLSPTIPFARLVHPSAVVDDTCEIGVGAVVYPGCILDMGAHIGANVLLNIGCTIAHDSRIGAGSFLSPDVSVAGYVAIGARVFLGIGSVVIDNVTIADDARTGGGAVVTSDIRAPGLYVGIPARLKEQ